MPCRKLLSCHQNVLYVFSMARQLIPVTMFSESCVRKIKAKNLTLNLAWIVKLILIFTVIRPLVKQLWSRFRLPLMLEMLLLLAASRSVGLT